MTDQKQTNGLRMYFFCLRQLSGLNKGIQAGHAALEYANNFKNDDTFLDFVQNHKTFILLDGGTSIDMINHLAELEEFDISYAGFVEPDLNCLVTAIAFIVPENVYNFNLENIENVTNDQESREFKLYQYLKNFKLASN
jgi:hypothetical protein